MEVKRNRQNRLLKKQRGKKNRRCSQCNGRDGYVFFDNDDSLICTTCQVLPDMLQVKKQQSLGDKLNG